jgi:hypothetical protein
VPGPSPHTCFLPPPQGVSVSQVLRRGLMALIAPIIPTPATYVVRADSVLACHTS